MIPDLLEELTMSVVTDSFLRTNTQEVILAKIPTNIFSKMSLQRWARSSILDERFWTTLNTKARTIFLKLKSNYVIPLWKFFPLPLEKSPKSSLTRPPGLGMIQLPQPTSASSQAILLFIFWAPGTMAFFQFFENIMSNPALGPLNMVFPLIRCSPFSKFLQLLRSRLKS